MAYVLGFFAADGTMVQNRRGGHYIEFNSTDRQLIYLVKNLLGATQTVSIRNHANKQWKKGYRIQIGSKEMFSALVALGFAPNKSLAVRLPSIPPDNVSHFVRGYFDGDGNTYCKKHFAKDRGKMRWVFSTRFTSGSKSFLLELHDLLKDYGVRRGFVQGKRGGYELVLSHRDSLALYRLMYDNVPDAFCLRRKRKLFEKAIMKLWGRSSAR